MTTATAEAHLPVDSLWNRGFAAIYAPVIKLVEAGGVGAARHAVVGRASGKTLEIGAGAGHALPFFPPAVTELTVTEPDVWMLRRLERRVAKTNRSAQVIRAAAEELPVEDDSLDSVVCNLVLCTTLHPERTLREIARVLKPGGQLLFVEHVRADTARWAAWQERARAAWSAFACGCQLTRETLATLEASPLEVVEVERARLRTVPLVHSYIWGRAIRPAR